MARTLLGSEEFPLSDAKEVRGSISPLAEAAVAAFSAYAGAQHIQPGQIGAVMAEIVTAIRAIDAGQAAPVETEAAPAPTKQSSAAIRKSITPEGLLSFEDGKSYKTLKRHLGTRGMTFEDYKAKHGLPQDYPSVSPNYSAQRSAMALKLGLGRKVGAKPPAAAPKAAPKARVKKSPPSAAE